LSTFGLVCALRRIEEHRARPGLWRLGVFVSVTLGAGCSVPLGGVTYSEPDASLPSIRPETPVPPRGMGGAPALPLPIVPTPVPQDAGSKISTTVDSGPPPTPCPSGMSATPAGGCALSAGASCSRDPECASLRCGFAPAQALSIQGITAQQFPAGALSTDGLRLYFAALLGATDQDLFVAERPSRDSTVFTLVRAFDALNTENVEGVPFITDSELALYFFSDRPDTVATSGGRDLYEVRRSSINDAFENPRPLLRLNTTSDDHLLTLSKDELTAHWVSNTNGTSDVWTATRPSILQAFSEPSVLTAPINSSSEEGRAQLSADGLTFVFASDRPGGAGGLDLWVARRGEAQSTFSSAQNLELLNGSNSDFNPMLSGDGRELLFTRGQLAALSFQLQRSLRVCE
jgi:hypothetical protein